MNKQLAASAILGTMLAGIGAAPLSLAADFGRPPAPAVYVAPKPGPLLSWTGFFIGGHLGYGWGDAKDSMDCEGHSVGSISVLSGSGPASCDNFVVALSGLQNPSGAPWHAFDDLGGLKGWLGGAQIGFNGQLGAFVLGAEVSASLSAMSDTAAIGVQFFPAGGGFYQLEANVGWTARAVGRLGFAGLGGVLIYADGGLALANIGLTSSAGYSDTATAAGWTVGGGIETKLSQHLSVFAHYDFSRLPNVRFEGFSLVGAIDNVHEYDFDIHTAKIGFNYSID